MGYATQVTNSAREGKPTAVTESFRAGKRKGSSVKGPCWSERSSEYMERRRENRGGGSKGSLIDRRDLEKRQNQGYELGLNQ